MGENKHTNVPYIIHVVAYNNACCQSLNLPYWIEMIAQFAKASASGLYATCLGQIVVKKVKSPLALSYKVMLTV